MSDYILSDIDDINPHGCRWLTIKHGARDVEVSEFDVILEYFQGISKAGVVVMERGKAAGALHVHVGCILEKMPAQWRRALHTRLKWEGKWGAKWYQLHPKTWTEKYTWQNIVGGYCAKSTAGLPCHNWGISPPYLTKGKVIFTGHKMNKQDKLNFVPHTFVWQLVQIGRRYKLETAEQCFKKGLDLGYGFHKCCRKFHWQAVEADVLNKLTGKKPDLKEAIASLSNMRW